MGSETVVLTYRYRVKDKHAARLNAQARAVNVVWNYCNEVQKKAAQYGRKWPSGFDLQKLVTGASKAGLDLSTDSAHRVCLVYADKRRITNRPWLRWRGKKSLGWVPFKNDTVKFQDGAFRFRSETYEVWLSRPLPDGATIGCGSFSADARGRWYINATVTVPVNERAPAGEIGIDLGLKSLAVTSRGNVIAMPAYFRRSEDALARAQRAGKKRLARAIHARTRNQRRDYLHKASRQLTEENGLLVVGNVSPSRLAKTPMAKSIHDAGWADFKYMLSYKALMRGGRLFEVDEAYSTQVCSECGSLPASRPKGIADLGIREWRCDECGTVHDRDVNAARNILRLGQQALAEGAARDAELSIDQKVLKRHAQEHVNG